MKTFRLITLCFTSYVCNAQLVEHFSDGNFSTDPVWSGSAPHFIVNSSQQLQLNNTIASASYLATSFGASSIDGFEWEVYVKQSFAGSSANFGRIYLVSNQSNLGSPLNGYYLQLGEAGTNDAIELFRQAGTVHTSVCRAPNATIANAFAIRIKVTRTSSALWTVFIDYSGGTSFTEAAHGVDGTFSSSSFLGVYCLYTIGNANRFFFDDFVAGPPLGDLTPPLLNAVEVASESTLRLIFSEDLDSVSATRPNHFNISHEIGIPLSSEFLGDRKTLKLSFPVPFVNAKLYQLTVDSVMDVSENIITTSATSFRRFVYVPATKGDIVFNELFADPSPTVGLPAQEFIELFNNSEKAFNLASWKLSDLTSTAALPAYYFLPGEYLIITSTAGVASYGTAFGLSDMPTLNNSSDTFVLKDAVAATIDSVQYSLSWYRDEDREQGGYTLERLHPEVDSNEPLNWLASESPTGGTPAQINSVFGRKLDTVAPEVDSIKVVDDRTLRVWFNEAMDSSSLKDLSNFSIEYPGNQPVSISISSRDVTLSFVSAFVNGSGNHLIIDSLFDLSGNAISRCRIPFLYFVSGEARRGVIRINEIMADPTPVVYLPEAEFVEIVNNNIEPFDLAGWTISDATATAYLPSAIILPGEFMILTSTSNASKFQSTISALGVAGFPSLSNAGEPIVLRAPNGEMIDSTRYDISWFGDDPKRDGGWSLERLRYDLSAHWNLNWRVSSDTAGGSPGKINSRYNEHPDQVAPWIVSIVTEDDHTVVVDFSEPVVLQSDSILVDSARCSLIAQRTRKSIALTSSGRFINGLEHELSISGVADTAQNRMQPNRVKFRYFHANPVVSDDIIITEIMADPAPGVGLPEAEYAELFNRSKNPVNLAGWQLRDDQGFAVLPEAIVLPGARVVVTSLAAATRFSSQSTLSVTGFPSINNEGESLMLFDPKGLMVDSVKFNTDWYRSLDKLDGGWSLEIIDPENLCGEADNWVASVSSMGGTPGTVNSVNANKPDLTGPRMTELQLLEGNLMLTFDEKLEKSVSDFTVSLTPQSGHCTRRFTGPSLRQIELSFEEGLRWSTEYILTLTDLRDCSGNEIDAAFASAKFAVPEAAHPGDVLINEILFNPFPGGVDFVEVYNQSARYIDMSGWKIARVDGDIVVEDIHELDKSILSPLEFRVFTSDPEMIRAHYPHSIYETLAKTQLPSMPDDEGKLVILDRRGVAMDSIAYNENMHSAMLRDPEGVSLERISLITSSASPSNWLSASEAVGFATPGNFNSNTRELLTEDQNTVTVSPEIISRYGVDNFALIEYNLTDPGNYANCNIVDQRGRVVRVLAQNASVGLQGFLRWDGDDSEGHPAIPGYYVVHFEHFDVDGNVHVSRKRVIVSPR